MRVMTMACAAAAMATGCATSGSWRGPESAARDPAFARAERERARLGAAHAALRAAEAELALAALPTDAAEQRRALVRVLELDPSVLTDRPPAEAAALAPDVLRVYDISEVLDDGLDSGTGLSVQGDEHEPDGGELLLERIAGRIREAAPVTACPAGDCLIVLGAPGSFAAVERVLDETATAGGGVLHVTATATKGAERADLAFDVPLNRRRGAWDGELLSHLKDFDVDAASGFADPIVGTVAAGFGAAVEYRGATVAVDVAVSRTGPVEEFSTQLGALQRPVRLQIPTTKASRWRQDLDVREGPASMSRDLDGWSVTVTAAASAGAAAARPAWRRVRGAASAGGPGEEPLVESALRIAAAEDRSDDCAPAVDALKSAAFGARDRSLTRRLVLGPRLTPVVLVRRETDRAAADVHAAFDERGVSTAPGYGFVDIRNGIVAACVDPASVGAVNRAMGGLARTAPGSPSLAVTSARAQHALSETRTPCASCTSADQFSFIQDFDLDTSDDAVVADPIVGVILSGAMATARPVASSPGTFDVTLTHTVLGRPIPTFTTPLGAGPDVTIQLPRLSVRRSTVRVAVAAGTPRTLASSLGGDERSFVLTLR